MPETAPHRSDFVTGLAALDASETRRRLVAARAHVQGLLAAGPDGPARAGLQAALDRVDRQLLDASRAALRALDDAVSVHAVARAAQGIAAARPGQDAYTALVADLDEPAPAPPPAPEPDDERTRARKRMFAVSHTLGLPDAELKKLCSEMTLRQSRADMTTAEYVRVYTLLESRLSQRASVPAAPAAPSPAPAVARPSPRPIPRAAPRATTAPVAAQPAPAPVQAAPAPRVNPRPIPRAGEPRRPVPPAAPPRYSAPADVPFGMPKVTPEQEQAALEAAVRQVGGVEPPPRRAPAPDVQAAQARALQRREEEARRRYGGRPARACPHEASE